MEFIAWPKTPRLYRDITITEKIDGTNGCIIVDADGQVGAQSRNRLLSLDDDNYGFAAWVDQNADCLVDGLGVGRHYGEWWGHGIQRNYGLKEKRFSLFNVKKHAEVAGLVRELGVVPVLFQGPFSEPAIIDAQLRLIHEGSHAARGFPRPEGICVYHSAAGRVFKVLLENDDVPKGQAA